MLSALPAWVCILALAPGWLWGQETSSKENADGASTFLAGVTLQDEESFEYVVVGAGAAGAAAAARLALAGRRTLLVEAGGDPGALSKIPSAAMTLLGSAVDWQYPTLSNNVSCLASRGRACRFSGGKCLGGSTSINYMMFTRGNRRDFCCYPVPGWEWSDLRPYFLRYEGLQVLESLPRSSRRYHNTSGPVRIGFFDDPENPWHERLLSGYESLGFPVNEDVNGVSQIGVSQITGYVYDGERESTARAYLGRKDVQSSLNLATETLCTKVIIDENGTARGIEVLPKGALIPLKIFATKEVVLSAGAIGTPQILMLSGVGRADHLKEMGIPVKSDLPVGDNMSDHVLPLMIIQVDRGLAPVSDTVNILRELGGSVQYLVDHNGPLASIGLTDITAFANTRCYSKRQRRLLNNSESDYDCERPTVQMIHAYVERNLLPLARPVFQQAVNLNDATVDQIAAANINSGLIVMSPVLVNPYSVGHIRLASTDPNDTPAIYPNYLSDKRDVNEMMRSINLIKLLVQTPVFRRQNAKILKLEFPGCSTRLPDKQYWRCYVRHMTYAVFHATGTCSLGSVLDAKLRVKGVSHLRVADASVFPIIPRGNTEAATLAVGERVVDFLAEDCYED